MPIALFLTDTVKLKIRFVLAVAYGASIGGIITPIGTPPNLILMGFLQENQLETLTFITWMFKTLPLAIIMLLIVPYVLSLGATHLVIEKQLTTKILNQEQKRLLIILSLLVVILFVNSFFKFSEAGILLSFGLAMMLPKIGFLEWNDSRKIPFDIMFLFGAGFSIAAAFSGTGLAQSISELLLGLTQLNPIILILIVATMITFTTEVEGDYNISVMNLLGSMILNETNSANEGLNTITLDLGNQSNGIYFIILRQNNNIEKIKLIKR